MTVSAITKTEYAAPAQQTKTEAEKNTTSVIDFSSSSASIARTENEVNNAIKKLAETYQIEQNTIVKILKNVCQFDLKQLQYLEDKEYNQILECLDHTLRVCPKEIKSQRNNYETRLEKTFKIFYSTKDCQGDNAFLKMLQASGYINQNIKSLKEVSDDVLKNAMTNFIKSAELKQAFANFKKLTPQEQKEAVSVQVFRFRKMLLSVSGEDKERLLKIFMEITKDSGAVSAGFKTFIDDLKSTNNVQLLNKFLSKFTPMELAFMGINAEDIAKINYYSSKELNEEDNAALFKRTKDIVNDFQTKNKAILDSIGKKIQEARKNNTTPVFTEEEQTVININKKINACISGYILGVNNSNIDKPGIEKLNAEAIAFAQQNNILDEVLTGVNTLNIDLSTNHPEDLSRNFDVKEFCEQMDKITDGKYSEIQNTQQAAAQETVSAKSAQSTDGIGFVMPEKPDEKRIEELRNNVLNKENKTNENHFTVSNPNNTKKEKVNFTGMNSADIEDAIQSGAFESTADAICQALIPANYKNLTTDAKQWVVNKIGKMTRGYQKVLFKKGLIGDMVRLLVREKIIKREDLNNNVSASFADKKCAEKDLNRQKCNS